VARPSPFHANTDFGQTCRQWPQAMQFDESTTTRAAVVVVPPPLELAPIDAPDAPLDDEAPAPLAPVVPLDDEPAAPLWPVDVPPPVAVPSAPTAAATRDRATPPISAAPKPAAPTMKPRRVRRPAGRLCGRDARSSRRAGGSYGEVRVAAIDGALGRGPTGADARSAARRRSGSSPRASASQRRAVWTTQRQCSARCSATPAAATAPLQSCSQCQAWNDRPTSTACCHEVGSRKTTPVAAVTRNAVPMTASMSRFSRARLTVRVLSPPVWSTRVRDQPEARLRDD